MAGRNNTRGDALCHVVRVSKIVAAPLCRGVLFCHTPGDRAPCTATERRGYSAAAMLTERSAGLRASPLCFFGLITQWHE